MVFNKFDKGERRFLIGVQNKRCGCQVCFVSTGRASALLSRARPLHYPPPSASCRPDSRLTVVVLYVSASGRIPSGTWLS